MKASFHWLQEFVDFSGSAEDAAGVLRRMGFDVASLTRAGGPVEDVVAAKVETVADVPNSKKLHLCSVTDGDRRYQVVCGAPNVEAGKIYPLARVGARLPGGTTIERRPIMGQDSEGMLCSSRELGIGADHAGIYALPEDTRLGADVTQVLDLDDGILDVEVTPNRPDALSHWGLARELAAGAGAKFRMPSPLAPASRRGTGLVSISDPACDRYLARLLEDQQVRPSPLDMRLRLERCGIRAICNLVDVTNYVLLELGHPLHVFDVEKLAGGRLVVRRGKPGETLECLDGVTRNVEGILIIADADRPQAIAGVMGGAPSAVGPGTRRVLLESAHFLPAEVRRASRQLNLSSESSYRFERGTDPRMAELASRRAAELIMRLAGGRAVAFQDSGAKRGKSPRIAVSVQRIGALLGMPLKAAEGKKALQALGFHVSGTGARLTVTPPIHRADVRETADVAEEIVRVHGYENLPPRIHGAAQALEDLPAERGLAHRGRERLLGWGFWEARSSGLVSRADWERFAGLGAEKCVELANPLSATGECLAPSLLPALLGTARSNRRQGAGDLRFFTAARSFHRSNGVVSEKERLAWVACGRDKPVHWRSPGRELELWDAKGWVQSALEGWGISAVTFAPAGRSFLHPTESERILAEGIELGIYGRLHPLQLEPWDLAPATFLAEFDLTALAGLRARIPGHRPFSREPALLRDFSLLFSDAIAWADIEAWIRAQIPFVENVELFDVFSGKDLPPGQRSLAFRLRFRHPERTLGEQEAAELQAKVLSGLAQAFGAQLRAPSAG